MSRLENSPRRRRAIAGIVALVVGLAVFVWALARRAEGTIVMAPLAADGMVLQREDTATIAGRAWPGWPVVVVGTWGAATVTRADASGAFRARIGTRGAGGPHRVLVWAGAIHTLRDVWIGEAWLCAGQSNMEQTVAQAAPAAAPEAPAGPPIRLFAVALAVAEAPRTSCGGSWQPASTDAVLGFSAACWHFGRALHDALGVPIGLVAAAAGGTEIEMWMSERGLRAVPEVAAELDRAAREPEPPPAEPPADRPGQLGGPRPRQSHSLLFNGMIAPLAPYGFRGVAWYQGEANVQRAAQYASLFPALIADWRAVFERPLPFGFVQLASFGGYRPRGAMAELRDAQRRALSVAGTGMVVAIDLGQPNDVHASDKAIVGARLAAWALRRVYGRGDVADVGPVYRSMRIDGPRVRVSFDHAEGGLVAPPIPMGAFEVACADRRWVPALAEIQNEGIVVRSPWCDAPVAVRFAWADVPTVTLRNRAGLPASPFRSDDWPGITDGVTWRARVTAPAPEVAPSEATP